MLNNTIQTAASGLRVARLGLATVGHNLANADTEGFSRQRLHLGTQPAFRLGRAGPVGRGALSQGIQRSEDPFLETQLRRERGLGGFYEGRASGLNPLERLFSEGNEPDLSGQMDRFFNAARELTQAPSSEAHRRSFLGAANSLADGFQSLDRDFEALEQGLDDQIRAQVAELNERLAAVAQLNAQVRASEADGSRANDLRDERDQQLQLLSQGLGVTVLNEAEGTSLILEGQLLVQGDQVRPLEASVDGLGTLTLSVGGRDLTAQLRSGELGGLISIRDEELAEERGALDNLAFELINAVNQTHQGGFGLDGLGGRDLFQALGAAEGAAGLIRVALEDPDQVAAAEEVAGLPGDERQAQLLADLQGSTRAALGNRSLQRAFGERLEILGRAAAENRDRRLLAEVRTEQAEALRDSVTGVSTDEEMVQLSRFQKHFEASSRVITTVDRLLDTVMALVQ